MKYALVIDAGTGSCRSILFDADGNAVAQAQRDWSYEEDQNVDGAVLFDPEQFFDIVLDCLRQTVHGAMDAKVDPADILTVCVTSQREGMVYLDSSGSEIYCAPSLDLRGAAVLPCLAPHEESIYQTTGLPLHGMFGLARLVWFKRHAPETYQKIHTVLMLSDWIAYRLSGVKASEPSVASSSQMFDIHTRQFAAELMDLLGLRSDIFPQIVPAGKPFARLKLSVAAAIGLNAEPWVAMGGSDTHAGLVGIGAVHPGDVGVIAGTTTPVVQVQERPFLDPEGQLFANCHAADGLWVSESNGGSTGLSQRWAKRLLGGERMASFADMECEARRSPPGAHGMVAYIGAEIAGERTIENLGGFIFPVPWDIEQMKTADFCRAVIETNVYTVRANLGLICDRTGSEPREILLCGGQSKSRFFAQMLADVTDLPVTVFAVKEATALGAAIAGLCGAGYYVDLKSACGKMCREESRYLPQPDAARQYGSFYDRWLAIRAHLLKRDATPCPQTDGRPSTR